MEWAMAVRLAGSRFTVAALSKDGVKFRELGYLVSGGLPSRGTARLVTQQDFSRWTAVDQDEYLGAFGLSNSAALHNQHAVFETFSGPTRVLVPALVVMRALFRPTRYLLPRMFAPQALEHIRHVDMSGSSAVVRYRSDLWRNLEATRYGDVTGPLTWMTVFPSASRFAESVHRSALQGRLSLDLPHARAKIAMWGVPSQHCFLATTLTVLDLEALEPAMSWAGYQKSSIYTLTVGRTKGRSSVLTDPDIPMRSDGWVTLSNEEWNTVRPILLPAKTQLKRFKLDPRLIFDGILMKLTCGCGWKRMAYPTGNSKNAIYWYRAWRRDGRFQEAVAMIRQMRCTRRPRVVDR
jgi:hypothetical protein